MKIKQTPIPEGMKDMLQGEGTLWVKTFISNTGVAIVYSMDRTQHGDLHHLSLSRADRYPDWDDIVKIKEEIMGDCDAMMIIPKRADYVNVMKNCFHVWETPEDWNVL